VALAGVLALHRSDKLGHGYSAVYERDFAPLRTQCLRLLEVGVFRGSSIGAWLDYFERADVIGVDSFKRIPKESVPAFKNPRARAVEADSTSLRCLLAAGPPGTVDIIIDDGDHNPASQLATYRNLLPLLRSGGTYYVEDVLLDVTHPWATENGYRQADLDALLSEGFEVHDYRAQSGLPDSVLLRKVKP